MPSQPLSEQAWYSKAQTAFANVLKSERKSEFSYDEGDFCDYVVEKIAEAIRLSPVDYVHDILSLYGEDVFERFAKEYLAQRESMASNAIGILLEQDELPSPDDIEVHPPSEPLDLEPQDWHDVAIVGLRAYLMSINRLDLMRHKNRFLDATREFYAEEIRQEPVLWVDDILNEFGEQDFLEYADSMGQWLIELGESAEAPLHVSTRQALRIQGKMPHNKIIRRRKRKRRKPKGFVMGKDFESAMMSKVIAEMKEITSDFAQLVNSRYGWAIAEQAQDIIDGESLDEQNPNAVAYIYSMARGYTGGGRAGDDAERIVRACETLASRDPAWGKEVGVRPEDLESEQSIDQALRFLETASFLAADELASELDMEPEDLDLQDVTELILSRFALDSKWNDAVEDVYVDDRAGAAYIYLYGVESVSEMVNAARDVWPNVEDVGKHTFGDTEYQVLKITSKEEEKEPDEEEEPVDGEEPGSIVEPEEIESPKETPPPRTPGGVDTRRVRR